MCDFMRGGSFDFGRRVLLTWPVDAMRARLDLEDGKAEEAKADWTRMERREGRSGLEGKA